MNKKVIVHRCSPGYYDNKIEVNLAVLSYGDYRKFREENIEDPSLINEYRPNSRGEYWIETDEFPVCLRESPTMGIVLIALREKYSAL